MKAEEKRLAEDAARERNWKRWGPYLPERQWGTVREDYSASGDCWNYTTHDQSRSRVYRWGEEGLLGITDRECRLCFAVSLWNGVDPILKERLYGVTGPEGNHGEDVKECYYYLDSTPTHSYLKALYKYPQAEFPYHALYEQSRERDKFDPEYELTDTGVFDENRYFDVFVEYAKAAPNDILIRITVHNRGPETKPIHLLPTVWFRNNWIWGCRHEGCDTKPSIAMQDDGTLLLEHETLRRFRLVAGDQPAPPRWLFTNNESNTMRLFGVPNEERYTKDAFNEFVVHARDSIINPAQHGTKAAAYYQADIAAGGEAVFHLRLLAEDDAGTVGEEASAWQTVAANGVPALLTKADALFEQRQTEANEFYDSVIAAELSVEERRIVRQSHAGLLWSKQFYHYIVQDWLEGDAGQLPPPETRRNGRNHEWGHLYSRDVISMPDKWEYPWFAAWDLAFHMIPFTSIDPEFAKHQLLLLLREWYLHPNGQLPAYEFNFSDVNPPVHAWACWRVYKMTAERGHRDHAFLARTFQKLILNFTWWVNRKDTEGNNLFQGGFLGLDNIGVFDRSRPLPAGGRLEQADGTAWMAFYCVTMLSMALELAQKEPVYEDMASKFFEHFIAIVDAMNTHGGSGLWDENDGFYYDQLHAGGKVLPMKVRSLVGLIPLIAVEVLEDEMIERLPGFKKRMEWFLKHRPDLAPSISYMCSLERKGECHRLLALPSEERLRRMLRYLLDENEFLSPYGVRSLSKRYGDEPYLFSLHGEESRVEYAPGESTTTLFGGNSNWRGPVWFPINYLIIEALERYHHFYGSGFKVEYPTGSGNETTLQAVADDLRRRLARLFVPDTDGHRPAHGGDARYASDPHWKDLVLFYEYFHGEDGRGCGASHQTGWTALVSRCIEDAAR